MENATSDKSGTISLPVQTLSLDAIKKIKKLRKIVLQFEMEMSAKGDRQLKLVIYPLYKNKGQRKYGKPIAMEITGNEKVSLPLPLTFGNLELGKEEIANLIKTETKNLVFKPCLYEENPHAAYLVTDDSGQTAAYANPTPPGRPSAQ